MSAALQEIPTNQIAPSDDNPRGAIDPASESFAGLCVSIKAVGILQPILVGPANGDGKHTILDGHRRHAAAAAEKVAEIPAMVLAEGVSQKVARLTANIQREDFSPVAEARAIKELQGEGLTQVQAADVLGKSERWVRERLRLLNMPEKTQDAYEAGALPLESMAVVEKIAEQAPAVAEALGATSAADDHVRSAMAGDRVPEALSQVIADAAEDLNRDGSSKLGCFVFAGDDGRRGQLHYEHLVLAGTPHDQLKAVKDRLAEASKAERRLKKIDAYGYYGHPDQAWIDEADVEAAEQFGCLLVIDGARYITDAAWLSDRFLQHVDAEIKDIEGRIECKKAAKSKAQPEKGSPEEEKAAKEERKRQREAEQEMRANARANNLELGQRAEKALRAPKLSLEEAKVLALLAVTASEGIGTGLAYCYHDYQDEQQLKNGSTKVTYSTGSSAGADLLQAIKAAKKPEEALGLAMRALLLATYADEEAVVPSNRPGLWMMPGTSYQDKKTLAEVPDLVAAIAEKRSVLPDAMRAALEAQRQLEAEEAEIQALDQVRSSRAKTGVGRERLLATYMVTEHALDAAVEARHLKAHPGKEPSYTITAAGKKRLEKLKAAEKERQAA